MAGFLGQLLGLGGPDGQQGQGQSLLGSLGQSLQDNKGMLLGYGLGGESGLSSGMETDQRANILRQKMAEQEQRKVQAQQIAQQYGLPPALASDPDTVFNLAQNIEIKKRTPRELSFEQQQFNQLSKEEQAQYRQKHFLGGGNGQFGLTPVYGTDANGEPVIMQMNTSGGAAPVQLPQGVKLSKEPIKMDAGTHFVLLDPITRQQVGVIPKDIAGAAAQQKIGEANGTVAAGADATLTQADQTIQNIEALKTHPGLDAGTGLSSNLPSWMSTTPSAKKEFNVRVAQLKGQTFLQAYSQLKGAGAITETEGQKAEAAIARLDTGQSQESFIQALDDLEKIVKDGAARLRQRVGGSTQSGQGAVTVGGYTIRQR
jgi:hypothetical protein